MITYVQAGWGQKSGVSVPQLVRLLQNRNDYHCNSKHPHYNNDLSHNKIVASISIFIAIWQYPSGVNTPVRVVSGINSPVFQSHFLDIINLNHLGVVHNAYIHQIHTNLHVCEFMHAT